MAIPTNISAATAIDIGILPYATTQDVRDSGTNYTVWYKYIANATKEIGIWAFGTVSGYQPRIQVFSPNGTTSYLDIDGTNVPIQIPVTEGQTYFFKIISSTGNGPNPAILTLSGENAPTKIVPIGSIIISDDTIGFPLAMLSSVTGKVLKFATPFPAGDAGAILNNGIYLFENGADNNSKLFNPQLGLIATVASSKNRPISCNKTSKFYIASKGAGLTPASITTVSGSGILGPTTWTLPSAGLVSMCPSNDETILYHAGQGSSISAIGRWDLINDMALSDLAPVMADYIVINDMLVLNDDTIIVGYQRNITTRDVKVIRYNPNGTIANTYDYPLGTNITGTSRMSRALDDPNSFWLWIHLSSGENRFINIKVSDGSQLANIVVPRYETGVYQLEPTATPAELFGAGNSCPIIISRVAIPLHEPTLASGLYKITPNQTNDKQYGTNGSVVGVKLPDPFASIYLAGD